MRLVQRAAITLHGALYRLTAGRLGSKVWGLPVLLLTTTGRRSGRKRTVPLTYFTEGDAYILVGSKGGAPTHPAWYLNLEADPDVEVQMRSERRRMHARRATVEEAERLWPKILERAPGYGRYRDKTAREIPLVFLGRRSA